MNADAGVKEKILAAAVDLMREDTVNITVRKIAAQAGVTPGLINYHFQSKDNLINIAAQRFIDETVLNMPYFAGPINAAPLVLRAMMKRALNYLAEHPNVARVSILRDLQKGTSEDNMQSSINAFDKLLQNIIHDDRRRFLAGHIFCAAVQSFFLRSEVIRETQGININSEDVRNQFVEDLIDMVFEGVLNER